MTTVVYRANRAGIDHLLYDRNGPVQLHVANVGRQAEGRARSRVGVKSGDLRGTIKSELVPSRPKGWNVEIKAGGPSAPYGGFHHDGTRPHVIRPRRAKVLHFQVGGVDVFTTQVNHPGTKPNRFLLDALRDVGLNPRSMGRF